jgi:Nitroreductase family
MRGAVFYHLLDCLLARPQAPWDIWRFAPRIHPIFFAHRVDGIDPGLYALVRRSEAEEKLRRALRRDFLWQKPEGCPAHLPFYRLALADCGRVSRTVSCHQAIAADACFSLGLLSEFGEIVRSDAWRYRQLHWEAGLVGHILYLEAEAAGLRGTGIGCFFDDAFHELLGVEDGSLATLYHFTVGRPLEDARITTLPPYPPERIQHEG